MGPTNDLMELKYAIEEGDISKLKVKIDWFHQDLKRNKRLSELDTSGSQCASQTDLILAACHNKRSDILYYLLYETDIFNHFPGADYNDTEVNTQRTEAFKRALLCDAFPMVEMLYDYWSGDLHWIGNDINKIITLGKLLEDAFAVCAVENQQLLIDMHSLIKFNYFQQKLYSSISNIKPEETVTMLIKVLQIYDEYSQIEKVRIPHEDKGQEQALKTCLEDKRSEYMKIQLYIKYEIYFRKLDFNVALLIFENLYVIREYLRERLKEPQSYFSKNVISLYKEIECVLYNFMYCTCEDWMLYLPANRQITREEHHTNICRGRINHKLILKYDKEKLFYGPVLFLERKNYIKRLAELKNILLENHVISEDLVIGEEKKTLLDENYLTSTYMSDYYALKKIVYYIKAIEDTDDVNVLMIERVLQVTGEMLKSSDKSKHLLESTKSLLQVAMSVETVQNLCNISNFLSQADEGQLSTRIDIANTQKHVFDDIKQDLKVIKQIINPILELLETILDKSLLEEGLRLLNERIKSLPDESSRHINEILRCYQIHGQELLMSRPLLQKLTEDTGLAILCLKEIIWICVNINDIEIKTNSAQESINKKLVRILKNAMESIDKKHINVTSINPDLVKYNLEKLPDNPNNEAIKKMLSFCLDECKLLGPKPPVNLLALNDLLLENKCESSFSINFTADYSFAGIEKLHQFLAFKKHEPPGIVRKQLISILICRVNLLKEILGYPQHKQLEKHLRRYKCDLKFRFVLEMVLADIAHVFDACDIKSLMCKSGKILREIDLGNVLDHGNPILEVIGDVFNSSDLSTELLSKAIRFAEDGKSIEALFKLLQDDIGAEIIKNGKLEEMNDEQAKLYKYIQSLQTGKFTLVPNACEN